MTAGNFKRNGQQWYIPFLQISFETTFIVCNVLLGKSQMESSLITDYTLLTVPVLCQF